MGNTKRVKLHTNEEVFIEYMILWSLLLLLLCYAGAMDMVVDFDDADSKGKGITMETRQTKRCTDDINSPHSMR